MTTHRSNETPLTETAHRIIEAFLVRHLCSGGGPGVSRIALIWQYVAYAFETLVLF